MFGISAKGWLLLLGGILFLFCGVSIFCFGRISVKHIEKEMAKENKEAPVWDKGIGARLPTYALIILFLNINRHASLVDVESTKRYARKMDWYLALFFEVSFSVFIIVGVMYYYLYAPS